MREFVMMKSVVFMAVMCLNSVCYSNTEAVSGNDGLYNNPSSSFLFNFIQNPVRSVSYQRPVILFRGSKPYLSDRINRVFARTSFPFKKSAVSLLLAYDGFNLYNEKMIGFSYARKFNHNINIAVQFDFISVVSGLGSTNIYTAELALEYFLQEDLCLGWRIFNPMEWKIIEGSNEIFPVILTWGVEYRFSRQAKTILEIRKDLDLPLQLNHTIIYIPFDILGFHMGYRLNPLQFQGGMALEKFGFQLELDISYHNLLGMTPSIDLLYMFK